MAVAGSEAERKISNVIPKPPSLPLRFSTFSRLQKGGADRMEMAKISWGIDGPGEVLEEFITFGKDKWWGRKKDHWSNSEAVFFFCLSLFLGREERSGPGASMRGKEVKSSCPVFSHL